ncbi:class I SAM-dependent methyltransferase [bacterium]|nr:class I SAM-dependent methyltransferase [bacterium]
MVQTGSELYSSHALEYAKAIQDNVYNALFERPSTQALLPENLKGLKILDAGCGPGAYTSEFLRKGADVTAVDLSEAMVDIVRKTLGAKVDCYVHDLTTPLVQEKSQSFDLIVCPVTIHYIEKLKLFYTEMYRLLKPGSHFVFSTHHPFVDWTHSVNKNYFEQEKLTQSWNTVGKETEVTFYRRPLEKLLNPALAVGFQLSYLSESGTPSQKIEQIDESRWKHLKTNPQFLFVKLTRPE